MKKNKIDNCFENFPLEIKKLIGKGNIYDSSGHSHSKVYYIDTGIYIKVDDLYALKSEAEMSKLMYKLGVGVEVIDYISQEKDYLVTREAIGSDLTHILESPDKVCEILANALKSLHSIPIDNISISSRHKRYIQSMNNNFDDSYYDESVLMNRYMIYSKKEALDIIEKNFNSLLPDCLIHGDSCLPNIIHNDNRFSSFIDFNMSGIGSKYIDLYWAIWSLQYNLKTESYTDKFLEIYGKENIDEEMFRVVAAFELLG